MQSSNAANASALPHTRSAATKLSAPLLLLPVLLLLLLPSTTFAQSDPGFDTEPGTGGRNTIQGNVYLPSGQRLDRRVRVRMSSVRGGDSYTMSDANGSFFFRRLAGGTYRITVDAGKEFETASETVDIFDASDPRRSKLGQVITVQVQLQPRRAATETKPGVVSAALASIPKEARDLYEKALKSAQEGNHKKAVEHLKAAIALYPRFTLALNELGVQQLQLGELDKAAEALRDALKLEPEAFILHLNYGIILIKQKSFREAEASLARALARDDNAAIAHLYRGRALIGLSRFDDAERELRRALTLGGDAVSMAHRYLGAIYIERGERDPAIASLEEYLRLAPRAAEAAEIREIIKQLRAQK